MMIKVTGILGFIPSLMGSLNIVIFYGFQSLLSLY